MDDPTSTPPLNPQIAQWLAELDEDANEFFQERAAVREHLGVRTGLKLTRCTG